MAHKYPRVDFLTNEEVDYELLIRGRISDVKSEPEEKWRLLRRLFKEDLSEDRAYASPYTIDQQFDYIAGKVNELRSKLETSMDERAIARLVHYYWRVKRCAANDQGSKDMVKELVHEIRRLLNKCSQPKRAEK